MSKMPGGGCLKSRHPALDAGSPKYYQRRLRVKPAARLCRLALPRMTEHIF